MSGLQVRRFSGRQLHDYIDAVAALRIEVFREFPYLYDGDMGYERRYLQTYVDCPQAVVVVAFDGEQVIGASTGLPMAFEEDSFRAPFLRHGYDPARIFYCAESVLRAEYRGRGLGVRFFEEREAHAAALGGFDYYAFCAVRRETDHPLRPAGYQPLDEFWRRRGYSKHPELNASYSWKDIDRDGESAKVLEFWLKPTGSAAV